MTEIELRSAKEIDYTKLRDLLEQQKWREADEETENVMLQVANRTSERWLRLEDIRNFPCEDLRTIDQLWVKYSNGRFGFSVQAKIYRDLGETLKCDREIWEAFKDKVGWRVRRLLCDIKAPLGHLPGHGIMGNWLLYMDSFGGIGSEECRVEGCCESLLSRRDL